MMSTHPYQDSSLSAKIRTDDLISRMTLEEKVGQCMQLDGRNPLPELIHEFYAGSLLHISGPLGNEAMDMAEKTRLGIPLLIGDDCIHGHSFWKGATIFPTQLAMACSWNPDLLEQVARITAIEVSGTGIRWTFSPVLCLTRDLRWGRVGETFGEDPYLIGEMALAMIRGYQGKGLEDPEGILATAKHYAGYSETQGGRDASEADISKRKLRAAFLPPFEKAARNGCMSFMTGYQSMEGVPSTANPWLLKTVLRDEWGFDGILVTDWDNVGRMVHEQKICADMKEAAVKAIRSGNDLMMATKGFFQGAIDAVQSGMLEETEIDVPLRRILNLKFRMGLFENPGKSDPEKQTKIGCEAHRLFNLQSARESLVLLQNQNDFLPLDKAKDLKIAVIGPNANAPQSQLGDWAGASGQFGGKENAAPRDMICTVLDGLRDLPSSWQISYAKGCGILDASEDDLDAAISLANQSDILVAVVGDEIGLIGEYHSTATLELQGKQIELLCRLAQTGKPIILISIASKPFVIPACVHEAAAIIQAFNPGMEGGRAIAELIAGDLNPSGRLTVSMPYHVGQQPIYYAQIRGQHGDNYADSTQAPHFAFGEGLSYTRFKLSELEIARTELTEQDSLEFSVTLTNTGNRDGQDVIQVYIEDKVTSATWYQKELKAFAKVELQPGQGKKVSFSIPAKDFSILNVEGERIVEPGTFQLEVARSSRDQNALKQEFRIQDEAVRA
jgi:beta-glucosidase